MRVVEKHQPIALLIHQHRLRVRPDAYSSGGKVAHDWPRLPPYREPPAQARRPHFLEAGEQGREVDVGGPGDQQHTDRARE